MRVVEQEFLRYSMLATAADCGELFRRTYGEHAEDSEYHTVPTLVGTAFHTAAEHYEISVAESGDEGVSKWSDETVDLLVRKTKDQVNRIIEDEDIDPDGLEFWGKQDLRQFRTKHIKDFARNYVQQRQQEAGNGWTAAWVNGKPAFEVSIWTPILGGQTHLRSAIDRVMVDGQERIVISDLKTGKPKNHHAVQLEVYRAGLSLQYDIEADYGQVLYVKGTAPNPQLVRRWQYNNGTVEEMLSRLYQTVSASSGVTGPFNGHCEVCDLADDCKFANTGFQGIS